MITQTEIICLAIKAIDHDIDKWSDKCKGLEKELFEKCTAELRMKRETLCTLYLIQTGAEYN